MYIYIYILYILIIHKMNYLSMRNIGRIVCQITFISYVHNQDYACWIIGNYAVLYLKLASRVLQTGNVLI